MRRLFLAACLALGFFIGAPLAFAQSSGQQTVQPTAAQTAQVAAIVAQYPNGGPGLSAAITAAVEADPSLAYAVAAASTLITTTNDQQTALGTGLADAANYFSNLNTAAGTADANEIIVAIATGSTLMVAAADAEISPTAGGGGTGAAVGLTTNFTSGSGQHSCTSPSRPGPC